MVLRGLNEEIQLSSDSQAKGKITKNLNNNIFFVQKEFVFRLSYPVNHLIISIYITGYIIVSTRCLSSMLIIIG